MILGIISELDIEEFDGDYIIDQYKPSAVLMGGTHNTDSLREELESKGVPVIVFKPWSTVDTRLKHYKKQFYWRNVQIIDNSDSILLLCKDSVQGMDTEVSSALDYIRLSNIENFTIENIAP